MGSKKERNRRLDVLIKRVDALEESQTKEPTGSANRRAIGVGIWTLFSGVAIAIAAPIATHVLEGDTSACSAEYEEVAKAVESGITNPELLRQLEREDCSISPTEVARDIVED